MVTMIKSYEDINKNLKSIKNCLKKVSTKKTPVKKQTNTRGVVIV
jgi:hypothetical protein